MSGSRPIPFIENFFAQVPGRGAGDTQGPRLLPHLRLREHARGNPTHHQLYAVCRTQSINVGSNLLQFPMTIMRYLLFDSRWLYFSIFCNRLRSTLSTGYFFAYLQLSTLPSRLNKYFDSLSHLGHE